MQITVTETGSGKGVTVVKDLKFDTPKTLETILAAPGVVQYGAELAGFPGLIATTINLTPVDACLWQMSVTYAPRQFDYGSPGIIPKPWDEPPRINADPMPDVVKVQDKCYRGEDVKGDPTGAILLPTGSPYANPPLVPVGATRIAIIWNVRYGDVDSSAFSACRYTTNYDAMVIDEETYPAGTLYMEACYHNTAYASDGVKYKACTARIIHNPEGHSFYPLYQDYKAFFDIEGKKTLCPIKIKNGRWDHFTGDAAAENVTEPVPLNEEGRLLTNDPDEVKNMDPCFGNYQYLWPEDWSILKIPSVKAIINK